MRHCSSGLFRARLISNPPKQSNAKLGCNLYELQHATDKEQVEDLNRGWLMTGTPDSKVAQRGTSDRAVALALHAVHAWGCYSELLGAAFLTRDPPVGQPMLKVCTPIACSILANLHILLHDSTKVHCWEVRGQ